MKAVVITWSIVEKDRTHQWEDFKLSKDGQLQHNDTQTQIHTSKTCLVNCSLVARFLTLAGINVSGTASCGGMFVLAMLANSSLQSRALRL